MLSTSLVIPLHQGRRFIAEAIASVLAQEERPTEILVVDDGSTDGGGEIARRHPGVDVLEQACGGPAAARNRGIACSTGDLIAFLDQDDLLRPSALRRHREALEANPDAGLSVCGQRFDLLAGETRPSWQRPELLGREQVTWTPSCVCARRSVFEVVGPFDESLEAASDLDWFRRIRQGDVKCIEIAETLVDRRVHSGCQSADAVTIRREMLEMARRAASARRGSAR